MKKQLLFFIIMFLAYGISMAFMTKAVMEQWLQVTLLSALFFSIITTVTILLIQRINLKKTGQSNAVVRVHVELLLEIEGSKQEIFQLCTRACEQLKKCTIGMSNLKKGLLTASTGVNWLTWGDDITIHIEEQQEYRCTVKLTSAPKVKTTLIDYGKNRDNVVQLYQHIKQANYRITPLQDVCEITKQV